MTRGKSRRREHFVRRCLATGTRTSQDSMIRFVVSPQTMVVPDVGRKLPGRGMWLLARRDAVEQAVAGNLFSRAARKAVRCPDGIADTVETLLKARLCYHISLSRKAGLAFSGFEKIRAIIATGEICFLLLAVDGSLRQIAKILPAQDFPLVSRSLYGRELGLAFDRNIVVHAAIKRGQLAKTISAESRRLRNYRQLGEDCELARLWQIKPGS